MSSISVPSDCVSRSESIAFVPTLIGWMTRLPSPARAQDFYTEFQA